MKFKVIILSSLICIASISFSCSKVDLDSCDIDEGVCLRVQNLTGHDLEEVWVANVDFHNLKSAKASSFQSTEGLYEHVSTSFKVGSTLFGTPYWCWTEARYFVEGTYTVEIRISDFDNRQFDTRLIREE